jgi:FtsK/SpoIIIE family
MSEDYAQEERPARIPLSQVLSWGGGTFLGAGAIDLLAHLGPTGLVVGGIAAFVAARHGPDLVNSMQEHFILPEMPPALTQRKKGRSILDRAIGRFPEETGQDVQVVIPEDDPIFVAASTQTEVPGVPRITVEQAATHTDRNSYEVYLGRSMTRPGNPAVKINFYKRHIKLIGASQHGKSSMAAALLEAITRTHDPELVQVAILDLEDKTGRLFEDIPHITRVRKHGVTHSLHARSYEQVLEYLEHISALIDYRYGLSQEELERQPLLIIYLEEFVDLKNYFKRRVPALSGAEREQAQAAYTRLVYIIGKIAARGLKVLVQLLMCAQVDYRDEDLQEALVNVTSGLSFCVRPSAAQAAGFYQTELLARNAREDKVGQAVCEMPDCKDLILAPEYDLAARLKRLILTPPPISRGTVMLELDTQTSTEGNMLPPIPLRMTHLHRRALEHYQPNIGYRRLGELIGVGKDKAGDLLRDLVKWGLIEQESDEEHG